MRRFLAAFLVLCSIGAAIAQISIKGSGTITLEGTWTIRQGEAPAPPDTLVIPTTSLAGGDVNVAYSETPTATGGVEPYAWSVIAGSLPPGLSINPATGEISGTPSADGAYVFTVCVSDDQVEGEGCNEPDIWDDQQLSITIAPETPSDPVLFSYDDEADMAAFVSAGGSAVTSTGLVDGTKEITKTTATDTVWVDNIDEPEVFGGREFCRLAEGSPTTHRYQELVGLDSAGNVLFQIGRESDSDLFAFTPGQTTFAGRGFFLNPITDGTCAHVRFHYRKGTGADALFEVSRDGGAAQSFPAGEATANVDRVIDRNENDGAGNFVADRYFLRSDAWEAYVPAVPGGGTPPATGSSLTGDYGAACDGVADDGPEIQAAFNDIDNWENRTLDFPVGQTCRVASKVSISNESTWTITGNGSKIFAANGLTTGDSTALFLVSTATGITINNLDIDGNRANRSPTGNTGGHNWRINNVHNSTFRDMDSINAAGDGIYVSATNPTGDTATFSSDNTFIDCKFANAFRDNVTVSTGYRNRFIGTCSGTGNIETATCTCQMTDANGANPQAGVNIEPNDNAADPAAMDNEVTGCLQEGNRGAAFNTTAKSDNQTNWFHGNVVRGNGTLGSADSNNKVISLSATHDIVEDNWIGIQTGMRFSLFYAAGNPTIRNNIVTGLLPISSTGTRRLIRFNTGNDALPRSFTDNVMEGIGLDFNDDWCTVAGTTPTISGNTFDAVLQSPDPGCP